jgi:hypothetical protein
MTQRSQKSEGALSHTPADENSNDIGEVAPAYGSRGDVFARSCATYADGDGTVPESPGF